MPVLNMQCSALPGYADLLVLAVRGINNLLALSNHIGSIPTCASKTHADARR